MPNGVFEYSITAPVQFSLDDRTSLRPGDVRFADWGDPSGQERVLSESEFLLAACVRP